MSVSKKKSVKVSNLVERSSTIKRHGAPNMYDQWPQGTPIIVAEKEVYIQTSVDETSPCWVFSGPYTPYPID